ncbi:MAG TPA: peptidoglycan-binding domain-containing protein [Coleofasciculaceae cyanobacterium]|jgi:peptidoglycan hydrolase-like protein with peptidoglycan-binding domain
MNLYDFYKAKREYTFEAIGADKQLATHIQQVLIWLELLDPPADGKFGPISSAALKKFQELMKCKEQGFLGPETAEALIETKPSDLPEPELNLGKDFASRIIKYMKAKNYEIAIGSQQYNIVYVEGIEAEGSVNSDQPNYFNDRRMVIQILEGKPKIIGNWDGTTEPGYYYTYNPVNTKGAARIKFGQYKAWRVGIHYGGGAEPHEALVQDGPITVHRDFNQDMIRTGDKLDTGLFDINQHWGYDMPRNNISFASAGCLVGRTRQGHREFMQLIKQDKRYQLNKQYMFLTTIIPGNELPA